VPHPEDDDLLQAGKQEEEAKFVGEICLFVLFIVVSCLLFSSIIAAALIYIGIIFALKRKWVLYALIPFALFGVLILTGTHQWLSVLGFLSVFNIPFLTDFTEKYINHGQPFELNAYSYIATLTCGIIFANAAHPFIAYYLSKIVKSKHDGLRKTRKERNYQKFRLNRYKYLKKQQLAFRKSKSIENFIGFDEFQERVVLEDHEPNQHTFIAATTGGGKTVAIATNIENALRQDKPIIMVDGKGERDSMLQFAKLCEKHGRTVRMFTDLDDLSFNFLKHGSPTQLRDKVMNLFEWSEPFYKTNCSRFLQLVFRMLRDFEQPIDLETVYQLTSQKKVAAFLTAMTEQAVEEVEIAEEPSKLSIPILVKKELPEDPQEQNLQKTVVVESVSVPEKEQPAELDIKEFEEVVKAATSADDLFGFDDVPVTPTVPIPEPVAVEEQHDPEQQEIEPEEIPKPEYKDQANAMKASDMFEGIEDEEVHEEPQRNVRLQFNPEIRQKVNYYRERFFGDKEEDEEDEGFSFGTLTALRNQLAELLESDLGHLFQEREDGLDLMEVTDNNEVAIFSLSGNKYRDYIKTLGRVVIMEVNTLVDYRQKQGKKSIMAVYDEFSAYVSHEIVDVINKSRSAGFECALSVQGLSDIDVVDPVLTRQILNNCNTYFIGRVNDPADAEVLAGVMGTYEDSDITSQVEKKAFKQRFESEMGTVRMVQRYRANPDEIRGLSGGEFFLCRKTIEKDGGPYVARVYIRNALDFEGIAS